MLEPRAAGGGDPRARARCGRGRRLVHLRPRPDDGRRRRRAARPQHREGAHPHRALHRRPARRSGDARDGRAADARPKASALRSRSTAARGACRSPPATSSTARAPPGFPRRSRARRACARPAAPRSTKGKVEMAARYGLTDEEVADGYVLTCQSVPLGDGVAVDYDASDCRLARGLSRANRASPMLTDTDAKARGLADLPPVQSDSLHRADRHGQRRSAARQDRRRRRRVPRRRGQHADPEGDQGGRAAAARYAGHQGLSRKRRRQALRRAAAADPARRACRRRRGSSACRRPAAAARFGSASSCSRRPTRRRACSSARRPGPTIRRSSAPSGSRRVEYPYYERGQGAIRFEDMIDALRSGEPGDIALLHGCCHNPTGADLDEEQWREVARRGRRARADPVRRHRLPGLRPRARRGCVRRSADARQPATK